MSGPDAFGLPADLLDVAVVRLTDPAEAVRGRGLAELQAAHPLHAAALAQLAASLREADRALAETYAGAPTVAEPHFDGYRVLRKLGEGAFGVVYLGEQGEPIRREVAIKVLRPGAGDRGTLARFDSERRFLARLRHPAIAQIFASGLLPDGRPWFVMEYVPGVPITRYCDQHRLGVVARVHLFARLCQGVQHAHEQGIVHRDLKPANILVVDVDGEAQPKIIDFGIARALERPDDRDAARTETGRVVGTPGYMSPEQMAGDLDAIDARSDVWSLGVVLYELLTGQLPWGRRPTQTDSDPPRPSSRVGTSSQDATTTAEQRNSQPGRLAAQLRGDLDWIVLKALSRERSDRYPTALDLAADVQRHLRGEPVQAGPPSPWYRLRKFVRRHRVALAGSVLVTTLGIGSAVAISTYRDRLLAHERQAGETADRLLERANDRALLDKPGSEALRRALADDALRCSEDLLREQPGDLRSRTRRSQTLFTLSQVSIRLGRFEEAEQQARAAAADADAVVTADPADGPARKALAWAERNIGQALLQRSLVAEARSHSQRAVDLFEQCHRDGAGGEGGLVRALSDLCVAMDPTRDADAIDTLLRRAADTQAGILRDHPDAIFERDLYCTLGLQRCQLALQAGRVETAHEVLQDVDAWITEGKGLQPLTTVRAHETASLLARGTGDTASARARLDQAIAAARAWLASARQWAGPYRHLYRLLSSRMDLRLEAGEGDGSDDLREMIALGEQEAVQVPDDREGSQAIVFGTSALCAELLPRGRRSELAGIEAWARLACTHVDRLPPRNSAADLRAQALRAKANLGLLADALGLADADAIWEQAADAMLTPDWSAEERDAHEDFFAMLGLRVAAHRSAVGREDDAAAMLQHVSSLLDGRDDLMATHAPALARQQALIALRRHDLDGAAAVAERAAAVGGDWRAVEAAAASMFEIWQAARRTENAAADAYRDRVIPLCERAIDALDAMPASLEDPWLVVPLAKNRVRLALALHDRDEPIPSMLTPAIETLHRLRDEVHANEWDEQLFHAGSALVDR